MELPEVHVDVISRSLEFLKLTLILLPLDTQTDPTCEYQPKMQILIDIAEEGNSFLLGFVLCVTVQWKWHIKFIYVQAEFSSIELW